MRTTVDQIEQALKNSGGFISHAAKQLGISHQAVSQRVAKNKRLQKVRKEIQESYLDLAESKLLTEIKAGNFPAICFFLKCQGKDRGYIERQQHEHDIKGNENVSIEVVLKDTK